MIGVVAATAFVASRAGATMAGIEEPLVTLTAVHFTYAGVGALSLAVIAHRRAPTRRLPIAAVGLTSAAPPIVATGFVLDHPVPQVGGAVVMSLGVWAVAVCHLRDARTEVGSGAMRLALVMSGVAPWVAMVLAVAWAASNFWYVPALSIADMARTHGVLQVVFVVGGLAARRAQRSTAGDPVGPRPAVPA